MCNRVFCTLVMLLAFFGIARRADAQSGNSVTKVSLGSYGSMSVPDYIKSICSPSPSASTQTYLYSGSTRSSDPYAAVQASVVASNVSNNLDKLSANDLRYNKQTDDFLKSMYMSQAMRQSGIDVMKWLPYEFIKIDGHNAMKVRYYRKGIGSDKEVYCENYTISISDYKSLNIIFSYQSVYATRYAESFRRMMQSISIYF